MRVGGALVLLVCLFAGVGPSEAVSFGQVDTFQDGTTMGWQHGSDSSPNPPTNVASGGLAGVGDAYVRNTSTGVGLAGSKMIMFNQAQWLGNYNAASVDRLTMHMANFGFTTLYLRVALNRAFASSSPVVLPPDGVWRLVAFDLTSAALTELGGGPSLTQVLNNVTDVRILSAIGGAAAQGDPIAGMLGVDNIVGHDVANFRLRVTDLARPAGGPPQINFTTVNGRTHRIERRDSFADPNWTPLSNGTNIVGNGGILHVTDNDPTTSPLRLYRVVLLP